MTSYTEDIIHMACDASCPSIWDMEVIRSFQSHPTTKDAVSVSFFYFFIIVILTLPFLWYCYQGSTWTPQLP
jgi:hypothetical protein